nr:hypothetical protein [Candidatus Woesearchaeota archaeon]
MIIISLSFVSANWFTDFFDKLSGKEVSLSPGTTIFEGLPDGFQPVVGYWHPFPAGSVGKIILWDVNGQAYFSSDGLKFVKWSDAEKVASGLPSDFKPRVGFYHAFGDGNGRIILSDGNGMVYVYNPNTKKFEPFTNEMMVAVGLPSDFVLQKGIFHKFNGGKIIFWGQTSGTYKEYSAGSDLKFSQSSLLEMPNLPLAVVNYVIGEVESTNLWSSQGYYRYDSSTGKFSGAVRPRLSDGTIIPNTPNIAYFDKIRKKVILWFNDKVYESGDGRIYYKVNVGISTSQCSSDSDCPSTSRNYCSGDSSCTSTTTYICQNGQCIANSGGAGCNLCPNGCSNGDCIVGGLTEVDGCGYLNNEIRINITNLQSQGKIVVVKEGEVFYKGNYVVIPGYLLRVQTVINSSYPQGEGDKVELKDVLTNEVYTTASTSIEGLTTISIGGMEYGLTYSGPSFNMDAIKVTLNFPQTTGSDVMTFYCPIIIIEPSNVCPDLIKKVAQPASFFDYNIVYNLGWNSSERSSVWINGKDYPTTHYYASWHTYYDNVNYNIDYNLNVFDNQDLNLSSWIDSTISGRICQPRTYWSSDNKENKVYICNWDVFYGNQDLDQYNYKTREVIWIKDNIAVVVYVSSGKKLSDEELLKLSQYKLNDFINALQNNDANSVNWEDFEIPYPLSRQIEVSLSQCSSEISLETCEPYYQCKTEPIICPPHGRQTTTCIDNSDCNSPDVTRESYCSPGICAGCLVPRWADYKFSDNVCIPYGTRFIYEESDKNRLYEINNVDDFILDVLSDNEARFTLIGKEKNITYNLFLGDRITIVNPDSEGLEIPVRIDGINFLALNSEENYVDMTFLRDINSYCNYDGNINEQKIKDYDGSVAKCQNNYECESNFCSSGECLPIKEEINKVNAFQRYAISLLCLIAHPISQEQREQCINNFLG